MKPKKNLGQHFLKNRKILELMCSAAVLSKNDTVLEVGPGLGSLTEILAEKAGKVIAVEKDRDLIPVLREKFRNNKNVEIVEGDILKISNFQFPIFKQITNPKFKIVANIPYYTTSRFLRIFLANPKLRPKLMVLIVQREVAERIVARNGKESMLSLSVKAYAKAEIIRKVPRGAFSPPPKVDSAIIKITITPQAPLTLRGEKAEDILNVARLAFQQKRKMLRQSIGKKITLPEIYKTKRPEELSLEDWTYLAAQN